MTLSVKQGKNTGGVLHTGYGRSTTQIKERLLSAIDALGGLEALPTHGMAGLPVGPSARFSVDLRQMVVGEAADAAKGIAHFMHVDDKSMHEGLLRGVAAIVEEIQSLGTDEDKIGRAHV